MKFSTALALAALVHLIALGVVWRTWPEAPAPEGEVVPMELRSADPPAAPPVAPVVAPPSAGGGKSASRRAPKMEVALAPEPGGDVPAAPPAVEAGGGGTGGGGTGGGSAPSGSGSAPTGPVAAPQVVVDHSALIAQAMERIRQQRRYPELARRRHIEGTVIVAFRVAADGGVGSLRVKQGVDEMLDQAALEAVRSAAPLPAALSGDGELEVPFQFYLRP